MCPCCAPGRASINGRLASPEPARPGVRRRHQYKRRTTAPWSRSRWTSHLQPRGAATDLDRCVSETANETMRQVDASRVSWSSPTDRCTGAGSPFPKHFEPVTTTDRAHLGPVGGSCGGITWSLSTAAHNDSTLVDPGFQVAVTTCPAYACCAVTVAKWIVRKTVLEPAAEEVRGSTAKALALKATVVLCGGIALARAANATRMTLLDIADMTTAATVRRIVLVAQTRTNASARVARTSTVALIRWGTDDRITSNANSAHTRVGLRTFVVVTTAC
jgi:hypothetical protein